MTDFETKHQLRFINLKEFKNFIGLKNNKCARNRYNLYITLANKKNGSILTNKDISIIDNIIYL